jgi:hypothetical protein
MFYVLNDTNHTRLAETILHVQIRTIQSKEVSPCKKTHSSNGSRLPWHALACATLFKVASGNLSLPGKVDQ